MTWAAKEQWALGEDRRLWGRWASGVLGSGTFCSLLSRYTYETDSHLNY